LLSILLTIQHMVLSYCHIANIVTILPVLSTILQGIGLQMVMVPQPEAQFKPESSSSHCHWQAEFPQCDSKSAMRCED